jgi:hypothetical protein
MIHTCNSSIQEAEAEQSRVRGHPRLPSEFEASLHYIMIPHLKKVN